VLNPDIVLRRATAADAADIWEVRTRAISDSCHGHYPAPLIEAWTLTPMPITFASFIETETFVVAVLLHRVVGFAGLRPLTGEIDAVFVSPDFARQGLGERLLAHLESVASGLGITSSRLKASLNSVAFYKAAGYIEGTEGWHITASGLQIACVHMEKTLP
jgi:GNAT superfamily N-acetyltransferase